MKNTVTLRLTLLVLTAALVNPAAAQTNGAAAAQTNVLAQTNVTREAAARPLYSASQLRVHDPSTIVRCGDEYWFFSTGTGVLSRRSKDLKSWTAGPSIISEDPKWFQDFVPGHRGHLWAPDVMFVEGRYLLYYSISTWGKNTSAIALLTTPTLDPADSKFGWKDEGVVIRSVSTNNYNCIDPALFRDRDGKLWMPFGSYWSGLKMIELDPKTGKRIASDSPLYSLAWNNSIEAAGLVRRGDDYFLFVNWGQCCRGTNSTYEIRMGRSAKVTGPYLDRDGKDLMQAGGSVFLQSSGRFIGPGHASVLAEGGKSYVSIHYYDGERRGAQSLAIRELEWDGSGWPRAGKFIYP